jgi:oligoribonuclease
VSDELLDGMGEVVKNMHAKSGLTDAIRASTVTLEDAGAQTLAFIKEHIPSARMAPLCGNSIGTDRRFLAAYLPDIEEYLHYRSVDVSTVKELVDRWYPEIYAKRPDKSGNHRAMGDIVDSVNELRYYRDAVFLPRP